MVGDGGFAQLTAEFATAVKYQLRRSILRPTPSLRRRRLHCTTPDELRAAVRSFLGSPAPAILDAVVDTDEKPTSPDELRV